MTTVFKYILSFSASRGFATAAVGKGYKAKTTMEAWCGDVGVRTKLDF
jgi:hypothetical protein